MSPKELLAEFLDWFDVLSVEELTVESPRTPQFVVFPNPVHRRLDMAMGGALVGETGTVNVYDIAGRHVKTVCRGRLADGLSWDLMDDGGRRVANGVYFVSLTTAHWSDIRKFVVLQ